MTCALAPPPLLRHRSGRPRRPIPTLVQTTLWRNGARDLSRGPLVMVALDSPSRLIVANGSRAWCRSHRGLAGLFRKDRGPSKALGRALCDEVKERFGCDGFLTTDELPRYGISRAAGRALRAGAGAAEGDCVVVYAYGEDLARDIDEYLHARLRDMS